MSPCNDAPASLAAGPGRERLPERAADLILTQLGAARHSAVFEIVQTDGAAQAVSPTGRAARSSESWREAARPNGDHRESSDRYRGEIFRWGHWRVAECRDRIQWLLQRQRPGNAGVGGAWDSRHYFRQRDTAVRLWRKHTGEDGTALAALLPERIRRPS